MKSIPSLVRGQGRRISAFGPQMVAALDIGSTKTVCLIGEWSPDKKSVELDTRNGIKVLGYGQTISRGVKSGAVVDIAEAERAIRIAVDAAERMARTTIKSVQVNITGGRPATEIVSRAIKVQSGIVQQVDVDAAISLAVGDSKIGKRHVLHLLPVSFLLDGVSTPMMPIGMHGEELGVSVAVVTVDRPPLENLRMAVERSHLIASGFCLTPYSSARSVLVADELELGTVLLDIGGETTNVALFQNGKMVGTAVVPLGGQHITNDIAQGLSTTIVHAERLKTLFGSVLASGHDDRELLSVPLLGERGVDTIQKVPKHLLASIILPRMDEILEHVLALFTSGQLSGHVVQRAVVTGGASQLPGLRELVTDRLGLPTRAGAPTGFAGLPEMARSAGFAAASGLLVTACEPANTMEMPQEARVALDRSQMSYAKRVGKWLAEAL